jgi:hypothetical protein
MPVYNHVAFVGAALTNFSKGWTSFHCAPRNIFELGLIKQLRTRPRHPRLPCYIKNVKLCLASFIDFIESDGLGHRCSL